MATGDIVLNMIGRNSVSPAANAASASMRQLNSAIDAHISKLVGETRAQANFRAMLDETTKEQSRNVAISGRAQSAINQLIFAVDDASTVYGQQGFAGAIRAASNNLTFAAAALGPWGAAIAVGVSAVTQLTLAFSDNKDEVKANTDVLEEFRKQIEAVEKASSRIGKDGLPFVPGQVTSEQFVSLSSELKKEQSSASGKFEAQKQLADDLRAQQQQFLLDNSSFLQQGDNRSIFEKSGADIIGGLFSGPGGASDALSGLSEEDRKTFDEMSKEIAKVDERAREFQEEMGRATESLVALKKEMDGIQERETEAFAQQQEEADLRRARRQFAAQEKAKAEIDEEAQRRFDALQRSGTLGISGKGPQNLQSGSAEAFRFINQARLGASAKSSEARELEKLNRNSSEILSTLREQVRLEQEAEPVEILDF